MEKMKCDICGTEQDEVQMVMYSTGRSRKWLCWECYLNAQRQAVGCDINRGKRLKNNQGKKRI